MRFCHRCVQDVELRNIIEGLGQREDSCPTCGRSDAFVYDTDINSELTPMFEELLEVYVPEDMLPQGFPSERRRTLVAELTERWHIFDERLAPTDVHNVIRAICAVKCVDSPGLFDGLVGIAESHDAEYLLNHSLLRTNSWDDFVDSVKRRNRFHTNEINLPILNRYCSLIRKVYKRGSVFFRGRLSSRDGFSPAKMGAPPPDEATAGRANSDGISCLYLASDHLTSIHEIRAGIFDYISVGTFELTQDMVVVDLGAIDNISPFIGECDLLEHAINKDHLRRMNLEIGRALRRSDSPLDYIPTQYIADFVKSIVNDGGPEYSGIEYNSTISPGGRNLAIFYPDLFTCVDVKVYHVRKLKYELG